MPGREMCEYIVKVFPELGKPEDIWNASPTGELYPVCALYWAARVKTGGDMIINLENGDISWL